MIHDTALYLPSLASMITFGMTNPKATPATPTTQFTERMRELGVTPIHNTLTEDPKG